jgi:ParB family chromosome partitioning protein
MAKKVSKNQLKSGIHAIFPKLDEAIEKNPAQVVKELSNVVAKIPVKEIEVNPYQPRNEFDQEALEELATSIKTYGLIQPITVRRLSPNEYQLISGERRFRASKLAKLEEIPAYIRIANDQEMLEMALVENIQRENLNAIEVALSYQRLKSECKLTDEKLSTRVGKKRSTITNYLRLLDLPIDIQTAIKEKQISMGHARALAGVNEYALQSVLFNKTISEGLSVRALENEIRSYQEAKKASATSSKSTLPDEYKNVEQEFKNFFGAGSIKLKLKGDGKGQIVIPFDSVNELNALLDRIEE